MPRLPLTPQLLRRADRPGQYARPATQMVPGHAEDGVRATARRALLTGARESAAIGEVR